MAGDLARKYLDLLEKLDGDETLERFERLRSLPFPNSEKIYNEAVGDYLAAVLEGEWE
jgi:hypothetical protein